MITIIYAHPWDGSFNKVILTTLIEYINELKIPYNLIDLNKDNFNPVFTSEELALFQKGQALDPLVIKYQKFLKNSDSLIFVFPIWWYDVPSILKGFEEKVFLKNFAYKNGKMGLIGSLTNIQSATIITTSDSPTWYLKYLKGNIIKNSLAKGTLRSIGVKKSKWINLSRVSKISKKERINFLNKIKKEVLLK